MHPKTIGDFSGYSSSTILRYKNDESSITHLSCKRSINLVIKYVWLIDCLTQSKRYYSYIHDENHFTEVKMWDSPRFLPVKDDIMDAVGK